MSAGTLALSRRAGVAIGFASAGVISIMDIANRIAVTEFGANPWGMTFWQFLVGGAVLLLIGGRGAVPWRTLRRPVTWVLGVVRVAHVVFFVMALTVLSATEVALLCALGPLLATLGAWMLFRRRPRGIEWPGLVLMAGGWGLLAIQPDMTPFALVCILGAAGTSAALVVLTEWHPDLAAALTLRGLIAMTGMVMVATGATFLLAFGGVWALIGMAAVDPGVIRLDGFFAVATLVCGAVIGLVLRSIYTVTMFMAIRSAHAEVFLMIGTVIPFVSAVLEGALDRLGVAPAPTLSLTDLMLGVPICLGALWIVWTRVRPSRTGRPPAGPPPVRPGDVAP